MGAVPQTREAPRPMPDAPRLIVLTHEFFPFRGGIAVYAEETARAAAAAGWGATVFAPERPELRARAWPFAVRAVKMRGSQSWGDRLALARAVREARDELAGAVVWAPEPGALLAAMYMNVLGRLPARRLVVSVHGSEIGSLAARPHHRRLFDKLLLRADRVGVISEFTRALLAKKFPAASGKAVLAPGALRADWPVAPPPRPPRAKDAPLVLLTVARVHPRKGQYCVIEALARLPEALRARVEYRVAGTVVRPAYRKKSETLAREAGCAVKFLGEVPESQLPALYADADVFAMTPVPHRNSIEGYGMTYLEAAACGLPAVAHRTGGVPEVVRDGVTGLVVEPGDRGALAAALEKLLADGELRSRLGTSAHAHARDTSWAANARTLFGGLE